ncbi:DUF6603 domain-containing protein [Methylomonas rhizoryzae]|uniref:DUF6603 domain-containing protein n=1 Tax=Methylomonas rhizoryzae TaxID=2608981 RepID=UPI0012329992|nr:DUF6603 domain-containing protein [Methylomonas rhizoryzae]
MNTEELYRRLLADGKLPGGEASLTLDKAYLAGLSSAQLNTDKVRDSVAGYFPRGTLRLSRLAVVNPPSTGGRISLQGWGSEPPVNGMAVSFELWCEPVGGGYELHLSLTAGLKPEDNWTLAGGFPFYLNSLLADLEFSAPNQQFPFLVLNSHDNDEAKRPAGMLFNGLLAADSVKGSNPRLFFSSAAEGKYLPLFGSIAAFAEDEDVTVVAPYVSLYGGLPQAPDAPLGGLFAVENVQYVLKAAPRFSTATGQREPSCNLTWTADLVVEVPAGNGGESHRYQIPLGAEVYQAEGALRFWSDLSEGMDLAWDVVAGFVPGCRLSLPTSDFQPKGLVTLTKLELLAEHKSDGSFELDWVSLNIETNQDTNRWVLVDNVLALNAIDIDVVIRNPATRPGINLALSGLFGIGKTGVLRLTADFDYAGGETDYGFSGQLIDNSEIDIIEILDHFVGQNQHPQLEKLAVRDFAFSVRPKAKLYQGEIQLEGVWTIPELPSFALRGVFFKLNHAGETHTEFQAVGSFDLADARLFVEADYVSNGSGWSFAGGTYQQSKIPAGQWLVGIGELLKLPDAAQLPGPVRELQLYNLGVKFNTATQDFSFHATAQFPIDGQVGSTSLATLTVRADLTKVPEQTAHNLTFGGSLHVLQRDFEVGFGSYADGTSLLVASYSSAGADKVYLRAFVAEISESVSKLIPADIHIGLDHVQLAFGKTGEVSKFLFGMELQAGLELSQLPLVGAALGRSQTLNVVFQLLAGSADFEVAEIQRINALSADTATKLAETKFDTASGKVKVNAALRMGEISEQLDLPLATNIEQAAANGQPAGSTAPAIAASGAQAQLVVKWFNLQKNFGPVHFQRLGIGLSGQNLDFLLDAALMAGGLSISLQGLAAECALSALSSGEFKPTFHLNGLGVDFSAGALKIGGALLRMAEGEYDGALSIGYNKLAIEALGAYRTLKDPATQQEHPSLFVYALIDYPLGGTVFFYVEGLAAGFGYNRTLNIPQIDQVAEFPLVKQAISPPSPPSTPMQVVEQLSAAITPAIGEYFLAVGVRFNSFKNIEGFVLLSVLFGQHFEIDVLGKATLIAPPRQTNTGKPPLISASLALIARFVPDDGVLMVMAKLLPDSHVFSPDCHITGGFAFYCWFANHKNKGDFVLTLGGYHKDFKVPPHYPLVPRIGMNWQVDANLSVKADAYFALTPSALMAGGHLQAVWQRDHLKAWFIAGVDFLIGWQPYFYKGEIGVSIGASYTFKFFGWHTVSVELGALLIVWGPPFSGVAKVHWFVISFDVTFGNQQRPVPQALTWSEFQQSFLPATADICAVTVTAGKVARPAQADQQTNSNSATDLGAINPRQLVITVNSAIPITQPEGALLGAPVEAPGVVEPVLGIAPMNKARVAWDMHQEIIIKFGSDDVSRKYFQAVPIRQAVPASLWGEKMDPAERHQDLLQNAICAYEIRVINPIKAHAEEVEVAGGTADPHRQRLVPASSNVSQSFIPAEDQKGRLDKVKTTLQAPTVRQARQNVLQGLYAGNDGDCSSVTVASWLSEPVLMEWQKAGAVSRPAA